MSGLASQRPGFVGKVPDRAEYLPVPTTAPGFAALDAWLSSSMEWAAGHAGASFPNAFASGAMQGFVFCDGVTMASALVGALAPSHDSAGRQFPLAFALPVALDASLLEKPELLPFVFEDLWAVSTDALSARLAGNAAGVDALLTTLESLAAPELGETQQLYASWAAELPQAELWTLLGLQTDPQLALRWLLETLAPLKGAPRTSSGLSLRVPLGALGGIGLCFWLDLVRRSLAWTSGVPSMFWSHDGSTGTAFIHPGRLPKPTLAELWLPTGERDEIADLTQPLSDDVALQLAPLPAPIQAALSVNCRVDALLAAVG
ncbi:MAG TPA: type VI secretion system-associated protein TagF [Polyangiaceae bacterium]